VNDLLACAGTQHAKQSGQLLRTSSHRSSSEQPPGTNRNTTSAKKNVTKNDAKKKKYLTQMTKNDKQTDKPKFK
jgi:hypothetical protein